MQFCLSDGRFNFGKLRLLYIFFWLVKFCFVLFDGKKLICFTPPSPPFLLNACLPQVHLASVQLGIDTQTAVVRLPQRNRQMCCRRQKTTFWAQKHSVFFFISTPSQLWVRCLKFSDCIHDHSAVDHAVCNFELIKVICIENLYSFDVMKVQSFKVPNVTKLWFVHWFYPRLYGTWSRSIVWRTHVHNSTVGLKAHVYLVWRRVDVQKLQSYNFTNI